MCVCVCVCVCVSVCQPAVTQQSRVSVRLENIPDIAHTMEGGSRVCFLLLFSQRQHKVSHLLRDVHYVHAYPPESCHVFNTSQILLFLLNVRVKKWRG